MPIPQPQRMRPLRERMAAKASELEATAARLDALTTTIDAISVTEQVDDGNVRVTVTSTGRVTAIELTDAVRRLTPSAIAAATLTCVQRAQARIAERVADATREVLGDDPAGQHIADEYRKRFPEVAQTAEPPEPPSTRKAPPPPPPPTDADEIDVAAMFERA